jgi:hypothetical protein
MADKVPTLEDLARAEAQQVAQREALKKLYHQQQAQLLVEFPPRFFTLARQVREGVARFNGAAKLERDLVYSETPSVTVRDPNPSADFIVGVKRDPNHFSLALRQMRRLRLPDALIVEGEGQVGHAPSVIRFKLRIDGLYKKDVLRWRIMSDGKEVDTSIDELADRLVAVVATGELTRLWTMAPFVERRDAPQPQAQK